MSGSHTFGEEGEGAGSFQWSDALTGDPGSQAAFTANVSDASISATTDTVLATANEGRPFTEPVAVVNDPANGPASDFSATIGWGDGQTSTGTVSGSNGTYVVSGNHTYAEESSGYNVVVTITDDGGSSNQVTSSIPVDDGNLRIQGATFIATEGVPVDSPVVATFTDLGGGPITDFTANVSWDDGTDTTGRITPAPGGGFEVTVAGKRAFTEEGSHTFTVQVGDIGGATRVGTGTVNVADNSDLGAAPQSFTAVAGQPVQNEVLATLADAGHGAASDFSALINWGDGSSGSGTIIPATSGNGFQVEGSHTYTSPGTYALSVQIHDDGGAAPSVSLTAQVSGASGGSGGSGTTGGRQGGAGGASPAGSGSAVQAGSGQGPSAGPKCTIPNVIGRTLKVARGMLKQARCTLGRISYRHPPRRRHKVHLASHGKKHQTSAHVVAQSPTGGSIRATGTKVNLVLVS